jgi:hypothetical protein
MKKFYSLIIALSVSSLINIQAQEWNISGDSFKDLGTLTAPTTVDGLTIHATEDATVVIEANDKTLDDVTYTSRLKLGGSGSFDAETGMPLSRVLSFDIDGPKTISIMCLSSSSSTERVLNVAAGTSDNILATAAAPGSPLTRTDINYTEESATTIYLYSPSSGVNIYNIIVSDYVPTAINNPNATADLLKVEYFHISGTNMGSNWNTLPNGLYIVKKTFSDGTISTEKIVK